MDDKDMDLHETLDQYRRALEFIRDHVHDPMHEQCPQRIADIVLSGAAELRDGHWARPRVTAPSGAETRKAK